MGISQIAACAKLAANQTAAAQLARVELRGHKLICIRRAAQQVALWGRSTLRNSSACLQDEANKAQMGERVLVSRELSAAQIGRNQADLSGKRERERKQR